MNIKFITVLIIVLVSVVTSTASFIVYGVPAFPDTWIHIRIASSAIVEGRVRVWDEYNTNWPLVNVILALTSTVLGLDVVSTSFVVLVVNGLSIIVFYLILRRYCSSLLRLVLLVMMLCFEPTYMSLTSSVQKESSVVFLLMLLMYIALFNRRLIPLSLLVSLGIALGHHYVSLYSSLMLTSILVLSFIYELKGVFRVSGVFWLIMSIVVMALYQVFQGSKFIGVMERVRIGVDDVLLSFFFLAIAIPYAYYRGRRIVSLIEYLGILTMLAFYIYARMGYIYAINTPPISGLEYLVIAGYLLLLFFTPRKNPIELGMLISPTLAIGLYSLVFEPIYGSLVLIIKAIRRAIPVIVLLNAVNKRRVLLSITAILLSLGFILHLMGSAVFGGSALYDYGEYISVCMISSLGKGSVVYGSWRFVEMARALGLNASTAHPFTKVNGLIAIMLGDRVRGVMLRCAFEWLPYTAIQAGESTIFDSEYLKLYYESP